ncbi:MAG: SUMF1/EgtB/PvdO family nonheme iron enzyme, partial [Planctomycetes bacterium]|nr:SUMF1/EgtB/PvdO family nonheme iron enzyme [Planctomycetota bacterium]
ANVWLEAPKGRVKILDFGLARAQDEDIHLTKSGAVVGTPAYMSLEQARGEPVDARTDLWSLGVLLYRLCTGNQPFDGPNTMAVLTKIAIDTPKPVREWNPQVPVALEALIHQLMSKKAADRPASAKEVVEALKRIEKSPGAAGAPKAPDVVNVSMPTEMVNDDFEVLDDDDDKPKKSKTGKKSKRDKTIAAAALAKQKRSKMMLIGGAGGVIALLLVVIIVLMSGKDKPAAELADKGKTSAVVPVNQDPRSVTPVVPKKDPVVKVNPKMNDPIVKVDPKMNDPIVKVDPKMNDPIVRVDPKMNEPIVNLDPPPPLSADEKEAQKLQAETSAKLKVPVETMNKISMKLVLIPPTGGVERAFYIGKYEVTQWEWEKVMDFLPSQLRPNDPQHKWMNTHLHPVERVNWLDCAEFCNKLSEREGLKPYYDIKVAGRNGVMARQIADGTATILGGNGYHIPTDLEWEASYRGGSKATYHFGNNVEDLDHFAWYAKNSGGLPHAVGMKKPNAFGLHDMNGNIHEWTENRRPNNAETLASLRGGSWSASAASCPATFKQPNGYLNRGNDTGLRVARGISDLDGPKVAAAPHKTQTEWAAKLKVPIETVHRNGIKMVLIPPADAALPKAYYLSKCEVTQAEWARVMPRVSSYYSKNGGERTFVGEMDTSNFPVEGVNWFDCIEF